jgi:hypothetical protein
MAVIPENNVIMEQSSGTYASVGKTVSYLADTLYQILTVGDTYARWQ